MDVNEALDAGAHIVTVPPAILRKMLHNPKTDETIREFNTAWANRAGSAVNGVHAGRSASARRRGPRARRRSTWSRRRTARSSTRIGRPRTVLDVGCGIGLNGAAAKRKGARVTGIEIVPRLDRARARGARRGARRSTSRSDAAVRAGLGDRTFDLVALRRRARAHGRSGARCCARLLRYVERRRARPRLAPQRRGLAGAARGSSRGRFEYEQSGILDDTHLRFFTRESASRLCESAGLEVLRVEQNPMLVRAAKDLILKTYVETPQRGRVDRAFSAARSRTRPTRRSFARSRTWSPNRAPGLLRLPERRRRAQEAPARRKLSLTVGMLTMDEEESVVAMIGEIRRVAPDAKILCVDSSMKDKTPEIAERLGARVLRQVPPRGHGPAMELLMYSAAAQSDALIYLDCDFTYPVDIHPDRAPPRRGGGRRRRELRAHAHHAPQAMPVPNFLANRAFAAMAHALHGIPTTDVHSGMRGYRAGPSAPSTSTARATRCPSTRCSGPPSAATTSSRCPSTTTSASAPRSSGSSPARCGR